MPTLNIAIDIPADKIADLLLALDKFTPNQDQEGIVTPHTPATAAAYIKADTVRRLRSIYKDYITAQSTPDIGIT